MQQRFLWGSLAIAGSLLLGGTTGAFAEYGAPPNAACSAIAMAKFNQWRQMRVSVRRTKTFADGRRETDELIVTENTAYKEYRGSWTSAGITLRERAVSSPREILANMRLASCTLSRHEDFDGQSASVYAYMYLPDNAGYVARGQIWISDVTGLPLREDMIEPAPPANHMIASSITVIYNYNGDVVIPGAAEVANAQRLYNNASVLRRMQGSGSGTSGPAQ